MKRGQIRELGEEAGREEASDDYPFQDNVSSYRDLCYYGRVRAQGLYKLRGRAVRIFAQHWAFGYQANCRLLEEFYCREIEE